MPELRRVPPGRAGRIWLRQRLDTARHAAGLLDRKLRVLRAEQQRFRSVAERTGAAWRERCAAADAWLVRAALLGGEREIRLSAPADAAVVGIEWGTAMGMRYPVRATCRAPDASVTARGPGTAALVEATSAYRTALAAAVDHAAALAACRLVDAQVAETRRLMQAIEDRWVPRLESALRDLNQRLEETERAEAVSRRWAAERPAVSGSAAPSCR
jgi:V/A-type H+-transporting ATPase subunit D